MIQQEKNGLTLNIVPVSFSAEKIRVGNILYENEEAYTNLREKHWQTHAFRFDSRSKSILNLAITSGIEPLGTIEEVEVHNHLLLIAKAIQQSLLIWLAGSFPIIRAGKKLIFWGQAETALLLTKAIKKQNLIPFPGLEVAVRYEIDCRMFQDSNDSRYLGMVMDVGTTNIIDIPVKELMAKGLSPIGKYICLKRDFEHPYLRPGLELLGCVTDVTGSTLLLTDTEGITDIDAKDAYIEPRLENLQDVIKTLYGSKSQQVLNDLK